MEPDDLLTFEGAFPGGLVEELNDTFERSFESHASFSGGDESSRREDANIEPSDTRLNVYSSEKSSGSRGNSFRPPSQRDMPASGTGSAGEPGPGPSLGTENVPSQAFSTATGDRGDLISRIRLASSSAASAGRPSDTTTSQRSRQSPPTGSGVPETGHRTPPRSQDSRRAGRYNDEEEEEEQGSVVPFILGVILMVVIAAWLFMGWRERGGYAHELAHQAHLEQKIMSLQQEIAAIAIEPRPVGSSRDSASPPSDTSVLGHGSPTANDQESYNLAQVRRGAHIIRGLTAPPAESWWWRLSRFHADPNCILRAPSVECWPVSPVSTIGIGLGETSQVDEIRLTIAEPFGDNVMSPISVTAYALAANGSGWKLGSYEGELRNEKHLIPANHGEEVTQVILQFKSQNRPVCVHTVEIIGSPTRVS